MNSEALKLLFIGIVISDLIEKEVRKIQDDFADRFGSSRQLKIPVHITLIPPFKASAAFIMNLSNFLKEFCKSTDGFSIKLKDFGQFNHKTVFINVVESQDLTSMFEQLKNELIQKLKFNDTYNYPEFRAHVTVANRDLSPENFKLSWKIYSQGSYHAEFTCDSICLLEHDGQKWNILDRYYLSN